MVTLSKKDSRKAVKGSATAAAGPSKPKSVLKKATAAVSDDGEVDSEEESEDEDEENGGISEKGMQRLMELVDEEDLNDLERAQLALDDEDEEDDEDFEDVDSDEVSDDEEEDDDEEVGELSDESEDDDEDDEDMDEDAQPLDNSILISEADPDTIPLDDLDSDLSVDEDAVPVRKVTADNKPAMRLLAETLRVTNLPFPETLVISSKDVLDVDPSDDLNREMAFYKLALDQVPAAKKLCAKHNIPFSRPSDYYAEMVKSDDHMERIRTKLVDESQGIKKSEMAKRQRDLKKYGKQIQVQKLKQREAEKKGFADKMQGLKRKRKEGMELGEDDEFGVAVEDAMEDRPSRGDSGRGRGRGAGGKSRMPRSARDAKFSLGGGGKRAKQNTKESTNDFEGWSGGGGGRGGRGGRGGAGGRGGQVQRGRNRPGKNRRAGGRA